MAWFCGRHGYTCGAHHLTCPGCDWENSTTQAIVAWMRAQYPEAKHISDALAEGKNRWQYGADASGIVLVDARTLTCEAL